MGSAEDDPAEDDEKEGTEDLEGFAPCWEKAETLGAGGVKIRANLVGVFAVFAEEDEREEEEGMICAPGNKRPVRAMPETGEEEDGKSVADDDKFLVTVWILDIGRYFRTRAAERYIDVIAEPSGQRYMPASPKLRYVTGEIRIVEVTHQFDSKEFSRADGNIRIAGEIAVDLERKENGCKQQSRAGLGVVCCPDLVHVRRAVVGYHYFLEQAPEDLAHSIGRLVVREFAVLQKLRQEVGRTLNRSGD